MISRAEQEWPSSEVVYIEGFCDVECPECGRVFQTDIPDDQVVYCPTCDFEILPD